MFIRELLEALGAAQVRYCVVGGVAMNLHGVPRMTYDLDLVVVPDGDNLRATEGILTGLGLKPRIPVPLGELANREHRERMRDERNLVAVTFTDPANPLREVDVLVAPPIDAEELVARSTLMPMPGSMVYVASIVDLIAMKRATGRAQDTADVAHLERLRRG
ncbi:nucleotidyl transferase AbiEii/AbiGii toxin family protein [Polyangium aurulentum]|uniref:nucleotidyl transferase AbiEii/AbiGii toxin family protein n=1 Tax=Polyangium aurulentum TaxID=2567896 RepID=UPI0010ADEF2E|nr:nucleotidyl transferase AbiEii/AbiGii toxin family protein [Polyangium aurulentum]UQA62873.1 nucleotidyl transferase AbiEii/AbiGii toxin family protein [Polyangium aurulentum]